MLRLAPSLVLWDFKTDGWPRRSQRLPQAQNVVGAGFSHAAAPQAQNVVGAGFSHAAAGALAAFMGFLN